MFTLYYADCTGQKTNCLYPHRAEITDAASFAEAVSRDYVCASFRNSYRCNDNYLASDCIGADFDNDHSEDPSRWVTPEQVVAALPGVTLGIHYSRNHLKPKNGKAPRPRFHIVAATDPTTDPEQATAVKQSLAALFPGVVDPKAMDPARFFFGTSDPVVEFHPGSITLDQLFDSGDLVPDTEEDFDADMDPGSYGDQFSIQEGRRNATMSRFAGKLVKRFGPTEEAFGIFMERAENCTPPLDDAELGTIWKSACRFARKVQDEAGYIPPEKYRPVSAMKPGDYSDIGQAKVIAMDCGNELAYSTGTDFLVYDGTRWIESKPKSIGCIENFLDRQLADANDAVRSATEALRSLGVSESAITAGGRKLEKQIRSDQMQAFLAFLAAVAYHAFVMKRRDIRYVCSALVAVQPMVEVAINELDSQGFLLNCPDGTYDLREGMAGRHDHDPADYITMVTAFAPGDEGKELWLEAVGRIFQNDEELIDYVQQTVGLCAIGEVYQEAITISYGVGSNGKSTFWNSIAGALGNYSGMISADALTVGCRRNVKPELAEVKGKRILIAAELEEGMRLSTSIVKQLSSTDEIEGERKYKDPFKFRPTHTLVLYTNHLPRVGAMDSGIWRRLIVIPFNATIQGSSEIKNYSKYLLDHAGPYIVRWIIEGAQKVIKNHFKLPLPGCVAAAIDKYKADNDWMSHFLEECCETGEPYEVKSGELYSAYRAFCARTSEFARSTTEFYASLEQRSFARHKRKTGVFVLGLRLKSDEEDDFLQ